MRNSGWIYRHKVLIGIVLALAFMILVVPYLVPPGVQAGLEPFPEPPVPQGKYLDIEGSQLYVEDRVPDSPRATLVLLHGFGGSTFSWRENVPFLVEKNFRVICVDMPGFGLSAKDYTSDYSHPTQARRVAAVMDKLGIRQAILMGHSMGTSVMLHFTHLFPERVSALISVDGALNLERASRWPSRLLAFPPFRRTGEVVLSRFVNRNRLQGMLESAYYQKELVTAEVVNGYFRALRGKWYSALLAMTRDAPLNVISFPLEDIRVPTLIIRGEQDSWVPQVEMDKWKGRLPAAVFKTISEAGHVPMEEKPAIFNPLVMEFLQKLP